MIHTYTGNNPKTQLVKLFTHACLMSHLIEIWPLLQINNEPIETENMG